MPGSHNSHSTQAHAKLHHVMKNELWLIMSDWACRYEDNGDQANNLEVVKKTTSKKSIRDYGDPRKFLQEVKFIFGENVWQGTYLEQLLAFNRASQLMHTQVCTYSVRHLCQLLCQQVPNGRPVLGN